MGIQIKQFKDVNIADTNVVGGKNASLGEMFTNLSQKGIKVPNGFATTADAFNDFLDHNQLKQPLGFIMQSLDRKDYSSLKETGRVLIASPSILMQYLKEWRTS